MPATTAIVLTPVRKSRAARAALPAPHSALFGAPPLIAGAVAPADVREEMWVRDVVDPATRRVRDH